MLKLPKSTEFNKRIPKKKFYENLTITSDIKQVFVEQIKNIIWRNKIASTTVNLEEGSAVKEIEVFEIQLNEKRIDQSVLKLMDQEIPYHIVFVLHYENKIQIWTAFKEVRKNGTFKVDSYFHTEWILQDEFVFELYGINLDQTYEQFIRKIAGEKLENKSEATLKESVEKAKKIKALEIKIEKQKAKIRKEKQFNKKVKLNDELKKLKKELSKIQNG